MKLLYTVLHPTSLYQDVQRQCHEYRSTSLPNENVK